METNYLGLTLYNGSDFINGLSYYYPQLLLLLFVLIHVQKEIRLGVFDKTLTEYETFEEGLMRYRRFCVCKSEQERTTLDNESQSKLLLEGKLDYQTDVRPFKAIDSCSEFEKFERTEELGEPIYDKEFLFDTPDIEVHSDDD